ncbi:MAG TPA: hypothetical protein VK714_17580 [Myxococcota bacterium]|nr:hypothetical protein [Myxococcota bacterium]
MLWRLWCFAAGLPLGALAMLAVGRIAVRDEAPSLHELELGAALGGLVLVIVVSLVARYRDDDHDRGLHLSVSASTAFAAAPALFSALADLPPAPFVSLCVVLSVLVIALLRGAWQRGPAGGWLRPMAVAVVSAALAAIALVSFETLRAGFGVGAPEPAPAVRTAIFDFDARVPTHALPRCGARPAAIEVVADRGAHPRFSPDGSYVWFDAATETGKRQVHRLALADRSVQCWTCGEDGNNMRPAPSGNGAGVIFDTDRWESWTAPFNTELHLIGAGTEEAGRGSRRLTVSPGADDHAVCGPGSTVLAWSQGGGGHYAVVSGAIRSGHGGLILGGIRVLYDGGSSWTAPLAWSPDARSLVVVRGNPLRPLGASVVDPATGAEVSAGDDVSGLASASFTADGGWLAVPTTERATAAGLISGRLGFLVAPLAIASGNASVRFRGTGVRAGEPKAEGTTLELGEAQTWGEPTGVALAPNGRSFVLGQRRSADRGVEERLVRVTLDCSSPDGV